MKITRLTAENFKRLVAVDINPDGTIQVIAGRNAQGKTSVLDSIESALSYAGAKKTTTKPVRDGEESASVTLELGDLTVTRTYKPDGTSALVVTGKEGAKMSSPQKVLDALTGELSFDPLAFANAPSKDRLSTLLGIVDLPFEPEVLAGQRATQFDARTDVNRRIKALEGQIGGMKVAPSDLPEAEISSAEVVAELGEAQKHNAIVDAVSRSITDTGRHVHGQFAGADAIANLLNEALALVPEPINLDGIQSKLANLEQTNATIREGLLRAKTVADRDALVAEADALTARIKALDDLKTAALADAKLPLDGLGFDDEGVTYQGMPFDQASGAEKLRVSLAIAMALNPGLRVIRITDGSLLDSENMALIEEMAKEKDYQVWIERVDETGAVGVVIEDGRVAS